MTEREKEEEIEEMQKRRKGIYGEEKIGECRNFFGKRVQSSVDNDK